VHKERKSGHPTGSLGAGDGRTPARKINVNVSRAFLGAIVDRPPRTFALRLLGTHHRSGSRHDR
jgi:hypothetical protein